MGSECCRGCDSGEAGRSDGRLAGFVGELDNLTDLFVGCASYGLGVGITEIFEVTRMDPVL
jgi:hypothetical protein